MMAGFVPSLDVNLKRICGWILAMVLSCVDDMLLWVALKGMDMQLVYFIYLAFSCQSNRANLMTQPNLIISLISTQCVCQKLGVSHRLILWEFLDLKSFSKIES